MAKAQKKTEISNAQKIGIGVGLTTAAVAAVGAYFLYGSKDAPQNRKKVKGWALKAKGDVLQALEKTEQITESEFKNLVDKVATTYGKSQSLSQREIAEFKREMADNWKELLASGVAKVFGQTVAKVAAQAPKKAAKKAPAKKAAKAPAKKSLAKKAPAKKAAANNTGTSNS